MNLIDRDALVAKLEITKGCFECKWVNGAYCNRWNTFVDACEAILKAPVIEQPEIIHCCDCVYYDPEHIEKNGERYEYKDMPKAAFGDFGTGLVSAEYGYNVGGRCCRDYIAGYSEDKRVFVSKQNYCGRARRREDG